MPLKSPLPYWQPARKANTESRPYRNTPTSGRLVGLGVELAVGVAVEVGVGVTVDVPGSTRLGVAVAVGVTVGVPVGVVGVGVMVTVVSGLEVGTGVAVDRVPVGEGVAVGETGVADGVGGREIRFGDSGMIVASLVGVAPGGTKRLKPLETALPCPGKHWAWPRVR